jgi:hypothetical protein
MSEFVESVSSGALSTPCIIQIVNVHSTREFVESVSGFRFEDDEVYQERCVTVQADPKQRF